MNLSLTVTDWIIMSIVMVGSLSFRYGLAAGSVELTTAQLPGPEVGKSLFPLLHHKLTLNFGYNCQIRRNFGLEIAFGYTNIFIPLEK